MATGTAALTALSGCSLPGSDDDERRGRGTVEETPRPEAGIGDAHERFDTVVDMRAAGADDGGGELVDDLVKDRASDDTLLHFPEGRYRIGQVWLRGLENFGIRGDGATFVLDRQGQNVFLSLQQVVDGVVEGVTVDSTGENTAAWLDFRCIGGENEIVGYEVEGFGDVDARTNGFTLMVEGGNTELAVDDADLSEGAINGAATFVFPQRHFTDTSREPGTLTFRNCVMKGWGKEGLYASAHGGPLRVLGGEYANNAIVQVRVGGGNAPTPTVVRGVHTVIDEVPSYMPEGNRQFRGIWLKEGDVGLVENCTVECERLDSGHLVGGVVVNEQFGRVAVHDTEIRVDADRPALLVDRPADEYEAQWMPSLDRLPDEWWIDCRNLDVTGSIAGQAAIRIGGRTGCVFDGVTIPEDSDVDHGIRLQGADRCVISDASLVTGRYPLLVDVPNDDRVFQHYVDDARLEGVDVQGDGEPIATGLSDQYWVRSDMGSDRRDYGNVLAITHAADRQLYGHVVGQDQVEAPP